jgi:hypothetical protein
MIVGEKIAKINGEDQRKNDEEDEKKSAKEKTVTTVVTERVDTGCWIF